MEELIMSIILNAGDAKGNCIMAIQEARNKNFEAAHQLLDDAYKQVITVHGLQSKLMQKECNGEKIDISILMIHAQDHITNALVTYDLAVEFVGYIEENESKK